MIASPLGHLHRPAIPNRGKKLTLKLLARDNTKAIAEAYFGKMSKIGEMLEDGTYSLSYGKAKACTVMLRWNTEDDVNHPYLEAIAIKSSGLEPLTLPGLAQAPASRRGARKPRRPDPARGSARRSGGSTPQFSSPQ